MRQIKTIAPLLALALAACGGNPDTPAGRAADARHDSFEQIGDAMKSMGDELKAAKPDMAKIQIAAALINSLAPKVETWFPAGSGPDDGIKTDARQEIWTKPDEFKAASAAFVAEAAKFNAVAQAGDLAAVGAGMQALGGTCKGCHDKFKKPD
ncbi:MAG TPA: cytochrome c [Novosphingobium sp.]|nr:cytochrome c [Novosphingobium sp.]